MMVSLIYELRENDDNGRIIEVLDESKPLNFIYGTGRLLPDFESNISSLISGDLFKFSLDSKNAYGERREEMIIDVPVSVFQNDGVLNDEICRIGNEVPMMDREGNHLSGVINEITDEFVKMDFNHPMAGVNLHFSGKIIDVRAATDQEIMQSGHSCSGCTGQNQGCSDHCS